MDWLLKFWCRTDIFVCTAGIIGNVFLIVGIVVAALDTKIAGFSPVVWILLAFILYVTMIFCVLLRTMTYLESKR